MNGRIVKSNKKRVATVEQIRKVEAAAIRNDDDESELIEQAADAAYEILTDTCQDKHTQILCGGGNNGSDGLSLALLLHSQGYDVSVTLVGDSLNSENKRRVDYAETIGIIKDSEAPDIIIDAIFGTGLTRPVTGVYAEAIRYINTSKAYRVSLDVPSGLHADSGEVLGEAVIADMTITFTAIKPGMIVGKGLDYSGVIVPVDIGLTLLTDAALTDCLWLAPRNRVTHKGQYGRVCVIAGSPEMPGAAILAGQGALYAGAGYVTLCVPKSMSQVFGARVTEATLQFIPDNEGRFVFDIPSLQQIIQKADVILIGNGIGYNEDLPNILRYLSREFFGTLVVDADGLNALSRDITCVSGHRGRLVLTPHLGELYRLTENTGNVTADAKRLAAELQCIVAAKSAYTVITDGRQIYYNISGSAAMAKGGSGDALSGIIAALCCADIPLKAAAYGCYRFGLAGEAAENSYGSEAATAGRILSALRME